MKNTTNLGVLVGSLRTGKYEPGTKPASWGSLGKSIWISYNLAHLRSLPQWLAHAFTKTLSTYSRSSMLTKDFNWEGKMWKI